VFEEGESELQKMENVFGFQLASKGIRGWPCVFKKGSTS
jgi:hypothetical protein